LKTDLRSLSARSKQTRRLILDAVSRSNAAHIASCFSVVEILSAVFRNADIEKIRALSPDRDRIILSKGHAAAALYATMYQFGLMDKADFDTYHSNGSLLGGHVSHFVPKVEHSTGALGHGLPVGLGIALGLRSKKLAGRVFVIVGDGELHEGSNWEALMLAGHLKLSNLCVIVDNNHLSQMGETDLCCSLEPLKAKLEAFHLTVTELDGQDEEAVYSALLNSANSVGPVAMLCATTKGHGVSFMSGNNLWHYRTPKSTDYAQAQQELEEPAS
jgi:transketolase